jgi:hypothetical protein
MEARISSIDGSCDFAGCVMRVLACSLKSPGHRPALAFGRRGGGESSAASMKRRERLCHAKNRWQTTICGLCAAASPFCSNRAKYYDR